MLNKLQKCHRMENLTILISLYILNTLILSNISNFQLKYFFNCYFNDLLAPLLLLAYINLLLSIIGKKVYSLKHMVLIIILCSFVWEYLIIFFKQSSVPDPLDVFFYLIGTLIYWIITKKLINISGDKVDSQKKIEELYVESNQTNNLELLIQFRGSLCHLCNDFRIVSFN